jgi:hypothetical protein
MARQIKPIEEYRSKLLKLIPSEIVAAYMVLQGIIPQDNKWGFIIVTVVLLILTPFYLKKLEKVTETVQIVVSTISFVVWIYSLGGPFEKWGDKMGFDIYEPWIASIVLVLWTLIIPLLVKNPQENE